METADQHVDSEINSNLKEKSLKKSIDKRIFGFFNKIIDQSDIVRIKNGTTLLKVLSKGQNENDYQINYSLKRLIRGVGSTTTSSRSGFFTTLVGFLKVIDGIEISEIFDLALKELRVGSGEDKIDPHANTGRILVCGALIRSDKILTGTDDNIQKCIEILLKASKVKKFHYSLSYSFIIELTKKVKSPQFKNLIWPQIKNELKGPWLSKNLDTIQLLLTIEDFHPQLSKKLFNEIFGNTEVLSSKSAEDVIGILFTGNSILQVNHPVYESIGKKLANSSNLFIYWSQIEKHSQTQQLTKVAEIVVVKILKEIFQKSTTQNLMKLINKNLIKLIMTRFQNVKQKYGEIIVNFYHELFTAIIDYLKQSSDDVDKLKFLKKFILYPGQITFDRMTSSDLINSIVNLLKSNEIKELVDLLKQIVIGEMIKNENEKWLNTERSFAAHMILKLLSNKLILNDIEWRKDQLIFLLNLAIFKTTNGELMTKSSENDIGLQFSQASNLKIIFYRGLELRMTKLDDERNFLLLLIEHCNTTLNSSKNGLKYLKTPLSDDGLKSWNEMYATVTKQSKKSSSKNNVELVFHILLLHMGLQLFNNETLAISAIDELENCMKRVKKKRNVDDNEPEWIEVVVDLFLHLLSHNSSLLRNLITKVFPQLCPMLTQSSIHQIISVLDMSEGYNPLLDNEQESKENDDDKDDSNDDESNDDGDDNDNDSDDDEVNNDDDEKESSSSDENDESNSLMDEEGTVTDQLRIAVRNALGTAALETDQESIDLDEMDENEAKALDNALSQAFRIYAEKRRAKKPTKKDRIAQTTVTHFRLRVLDLIEIYIKTEPKMSYLLEILIGLFDLMNYAAKDRGPVMAKLQGILNKLTGLKQIDNIDDVTDENICETLKNLIEKKFTTIAITDRNQYLNKCVNFLINCSEIICSKNQKTKTSKIFDILKELLQDFITTRNSSVPLNIFTLIFQQQWTGIWELIKILNNSILKENLQSIRRSQIFGLYNQFYHNHRFIKNDLNQSKKLINKIEKQINFYIEQENQLTKLTQKVFGELLQLLIDIDKFHKNSDFTIIETSFDWNDIKLKIQNIRKNLILDSAKKNYRKFCQIMKIDLIETNKKQENGHVVANENNVTDSDDDDEDADNANDDKIPNGETSDSKETTKAQKRKAIKEKRKIKKLKNDARVKISSAGLNGGVSFKGLKEVQDDGENIKSPAKKKCKKSKKKIDKEMSDSE